MAADPTPPTSVWKNRIVGFDPAVDAEQLLANPANWRIHPKAQRKALEAVLDDVGLVGAAIVNTVTGHLIDGHMRTESALSKGTTLPVIYVELSPEEEKVVLASYDAIGSLAVQDDDQLRPLLADIKDTHSQVHQLLTDAKDFGANAMGTTTRGDGSLLKLVDVVISDPQHDVRPGDVWRVGPHVLHCAPALGYPTWLTALVEWVKQHGELACKVDYPGPLVAITTKAESHRLFMVQPDPYVAGHILDRSAEVYGGDAIQQLVRGARSDDPTDDEIEPPFTGTGRTSDKPKKRKAA